MTAEAQEKIPFMVVCDCGHEFVALYTPMPMEKFCVILQKLHCPMCGNDPEKIKVKNDK